VQLVDATMKKHERPANQSLTLHHSSAGACGLLPLLETKEVLAGPAALGPSPCPPSAHPCPHVDEIGKHYHVHGRGRICSLIPTVGMTRAPPFPLSCLEIAPVVPAVPRSDAFFLGGIDSPPFPALLCHATRQHGSRINCASSSAQIGR
jgi:hypothetical protein